MLKRLANWLNYINYNLHPPCDAMCGCIFSLNRYANCCCKTRFWCICIFRFRLYFKRAKYSLPFMVCKCVFVFSSLFFFSISNKLNRTVWCNESCNRHKIAIKHKERMESKSTMLLIYQASCITVYILRSIVSCFAFLRGGEYTQR